MSVNNAVPGGGEWKLTDVSLVVKKGDLDPASVSSRLGLQATSAGAPASEPWGPSGETGGYWSLTCDERVTRNPLEQLEYVVAAAEGSARQLRAMGEEGFEVSISVYGFAGHGARYLIPAVILRRVAHLGIPLRITPNMNER